MHVRVLRNTLHEDKFWNLRPMLRAEDVREMVHLGLEGLSLINSHFTLPRSMTCSISIEQMMYNEEIFHLQFMSRFAVKNSGACGLILIFDLSNPKMKIQHAKNLFKDNSYVPCFSADVCKIMIWCRLVSGDKGLIPTG